MYFKTKDFYEALGIPINSHYYGDIIGFSILEDQCIMKL